MATRIYFLVAFSYNAGVVRNTQDWLSQRLKAMREDKQDTLTGLLSALE